MRWMAIALLLVSPACSSAAAYAHGPVCHERSVLQEISREIRLKNYYSTPIGPELVAEYPTADPNIVTCQACVLSAPYDFRIGDSPLGRCLLRTFDVRIVTNGFIVNDRR